MTTLKQAGELKGAVALGQPCRCITFEDTSIFLSASAIFVAQILQLLDVKMLLSTVSLIVKVCVVIITGYAQQHLHIHQLLNLSAKKWRWRSEKCSYLQK